MEKAAAGRAEDPQGGETAERLDLNASDGESQLAASGVGYIDLVPWLEAVEFAKERWSADAVEVPVDPRLPACTRTDAGFQPRCVRQISRNVHQPGARDPSRLDQGVNLQCRDPQSVWRDGADCWVEESLADHWLEEVSAPTLPYPRGRGRKKAPTLPSPRGGGYGGVCGSQS